MMTVTGALSTFSPLAGRHSGASLALASSPTHHTRRAGMQLAEVGPIFISSQMASSRSLGTG